MPVVCTLICCSYAQATSHSTNCINNCITVFICLSWLIHLGMVHKCIVPGCPNQSKRKTDAKGKKLKFHRQPFKNQKVLQVWVELMGRTLTEVTVSNCICRAHFSKRGNLDLRPPTYFHGLYLALHHLHH